MKINWNWKYLSTFEPAALRGVWIAIIGLLAALGLKLSDAVSGKADAIIAAAVLIVPILQGLWTRQAVVPTERVNQLVDDALVTDPPAVPTEGEDQASELPPENFEPAPVQDDDMPVEELPPDPPPDTPVTPAVVAPKAPESAP